MSLSEIDVTRGILERFSSDFLEALTSDVVVAGDRKSVV